jgi:UDP:flavonoid glycosyltransferase YjiC (YdhE family)
VVVRALVVTWAPGGNLPPLLAGARLLAERGHEVALLCSGATRSGAERLGLPVSGYRRSPDLDTRISFEAQAEQAMAVAAGTEIALDARDVLERERPDVAIIDCMLPATIAAARATGTPVASLVHFLYGLARGTMLQGRGGFTTDLATLARTHRALGLAPAADGLAAWEAPELLLVTAPSWLDVDAGAPDHVVHAGPLGVAASAQPRPAAPAERPRLLLTFGTTVMEGRVSLIQRACAAVAALDADAQLTLGRTVAVSAPRGIEVLAHADHDRLMPGCAAVLSHGGLGTVLRALAHGVPLLLLPLGRDQSFNAGRIEQLGAGIRLASDASSEQIRTALQVLLDEPRYGAAAAQAAARIAADEPDRRAGEALERLAAT